MIYICVDSLISDLMLLLRGSDIPSFIALYFMNHLQMSIATIHCMYCRIAHKMNMINQQYLTTN